MNKLRIITCLMGAVAVCLAAIGLTACGGGGGIPGDAIAEVGETVITKAELSHWMATLTGGDYYEVARSHTVPAGLVSEPPNYGTCVASLEGAAAQASAVQPKPANAAPKQTTAQLLRKCQELYRALRLQATAYLINVTWVTDVYAEDGVRASSQDIQRALARDKATHYSEPGAFERYLAGTRRSLADELIVVKLNVLSEKIQQKVRAEGLQRVTHDLSEAALRWTAKTSCRPGYVVPHCKQFKKWVPSTDPAVLLEQVATITGIPCINREACGGTGGGQL